MTYVTRAGERRILLVIPTRVSPPVITRSEATTDRFPAKACSTDLVKEIPRYARDDKRALGMTIERSG